MEIKDESQKFVMMKVTPFVKILRLSLGAITFSPSTEKAIKSHEH